MSIINFSSLSSDQQELVKNVFGSNDRETGRRFECAGCVVFLAATAAGENTYFWHYGASNGFVVLPVADSSATLDYEIDLITAGGRDFDTDGVDRTPPFEVFIHFDNRQLPDDVFIPSGNWGDSIPPRQYATAVGLLIGEPVPWLGHVWLKPWEVTEELWQAAVAAKLILPGGKIVELK